jgi:REP element-mobilizing transposase RayT
MYQNVCSVCPNGTGFIQPGMKCREAFSKIWIHVVFSTKERKRYLQNEQFRTEMFRLLSHEVSESGCVSAGVNGYFDHVHLLVGLSRTITVANLIKNIKTETSKWAKNTRNGVSTFQWQAGYGAFSVSHSQCPVVSKYIRNQEQHHATGISFQDEYRNFCLRHEIEIDDRYVWD